jgi:hypothetical protein
MPATIVGGIALEKHRYLPAPANRGYLLQCACQAAIDTPTSAVQMLDDLTVQCGSPSKPLALVRNVVVPAIPDRTLQAPSPQPSENSTAPGTPSGIAPRSTTRRSSPRTPATA